MIKRIIEEATSSTSHLQRKEIHIRYIHETIMQNKQGIELVSNYDIALLINLRFWPNPFLK